MSNYKQIYYKYLSKISLTSIFIYSITLLTIRSYAVEILSD